MRVSACVSVCSVSAIVVHYWFHILFNGAASCLSLFYAIILCSKREGYCILKRVYWSVCCCLCRARHVCLSADFGSVMSSLGYCCCFCCYWWCLPSWHRNREVFWSLNEFSSASWMQPHNQRPPGDRFINLFLSVNIFNDKNNTFFHGTRALNFILMLPFIFVSFKKSKQRKKCASGQTAPFTSL